MYDKQTINSENNFDVDVSVKKREGHKLGRYRLCPDLTNRYAAWITNPTVQPDGKTEMGVPIPALENTEYSKEYSEENKL